MKKTIICCLITLAAFSLAFPAGALKSNTINETCAEYCADIAKNHTIEVGDKKLSGLIVEPKEGTKNEIVKDTDVAITELWGVFKGNNASFAPVINANRDNEIYFNDNAFSSENLSFVYTNMGQSAQPYHTVKDPNTKENIVVDYKFQCSPIALMFQSVLSGLQDKVHIYISQAQAERKLLSEEKEANIENFKSLLNKEIQISINGQVCECVIDNIYLDNFEHNYKFSNYDYYYASDIGTIIGDFVYVILTHLKPNVFPKDLRRQSLYVMSEYAFRNKYYIEYAKESYKLDEYSFDYARFNLKDDYSPDINYLNNSLKNDRKDTWSTLITVVLFLVFCFDLVLLYIFNLFKQPLSILLLTTSSFAPYLLFKLIFLLTKNLYIFSSYSLLLELILISIFILSIIILNCFRRGVVLE